MKPVNNIYPEFQDRVVEKWQKTAPHKVAGQRLNPYDDKTRIDFLLLTTEDNFDIPNKRVINFEYDTEVIELYSEREKQVFRRANKAAIESGLLVLYEGEAKEISTVNALTDSDLAQIIKEAKPNNRTRYKEELNKMTSWVPIARLLEMLKDSNNPQWMHELTSARLEEVTKQDY